MQATSDVIACRGGEAKVSQCGAPALTGRVGLHCADHTGMGNRHSSRLQRVTSQKKFFRIISGNMPYFKLWCFLRKSHNLQGLVKDTAKARGITCKQNNAILKKEK